MTEGVVNVGVDLGTTTTKICALDGKNDVIKELSIAHEALLSTDNANEHRQDAKKIILAAVDLLKSIGDVINIETDEANIALSGQMHGIVLWNSEALLNDEFCCSPLITWMDSSVPMDFILSLPKWREGELHQGYGMVTLAWLYKNHLLDRNWDQCGTIMDMFICYITRQAQCVIGMQNAFSWGYCNYFGKWTVPADIVPLSILPQISFNHKKIGVINLGNVGFSAHVYTSLGDLQCTALALRVENCAALNLGTSAQLFCRMHLGYRMEKLPKSSLIEIPFFNQQRILVAASLNGGNSIDLLVNKIVEWSLELLGEDKRKIDFGSIEKILENSFEKPKCSVQPVFYGERDAKIRAHIDDIQPDTTISEILHATIYGIVKNLYRMFPPQLLHNNNITRICLMGNAGKPYFRRAIEYYFREFELISANFPPTASYGAALSLKQYHKQF